MTSYISDTPPFTRRSVILCAIVGLHVFIAWALATGLARRAIELVAPPLKTEIIDEAPKHDEPPPPPPPPQMEHPPVEVPPPDVDIPLPVEPQPTAIADVTDKPVPTAPAAPPAPPPRKRVNREGGGPGKGFPSTEDYYPPAAKRSSEEGDVTVHVCVGPNGKLTEDPTVVQTSGSSRLDEGAVKLAKAGSGHYQPTTEDGQPVNACFPFRVRFALRK